MTLRNWQDMFSMFIDLKHSTTSILYALLENKDFMDDQIPGHQQHHTG